MELALVIDTSLSEPLHHQVYSQLRRAILAGRLRSGQRLPASRSLAKSLRLSRTTVTQGYDQLISEGYLQTRPGAGTYVCPQLPENLLTTDVVEQLPHTPIEIPLSDYGNRVQRLSARKVPADFEISFRYGQPALDLFPVELWRKLLSKYCRETNHWLSYATSATGYEPLRRAVSDYLQQSRAVRCIPEQVIITNGSQQALSLITQLLVNPDDPVAMEDPGYLGARQIFQANGGKVVTHPIRS